MKLRKELEKVAPSITHRNRYYFVLHDDTKPKLLVFALTIRNNPLIVLGGRRAKILYQVALQTLRRFMDVNEIIENSLCLFHVSPDIGETLIIWIISQASNPKVDEELLYALLRLGVPESVVKLREELYKKSRYRTAKNTEIYPLIQTRLIIKASKSIRKLLDVLIP